MTTHPGERASCALPVAAMKSNVHKKRERDRNSSPDLLSAGISGLLDILIGRLSANSDVMHREFSTQSCFRLRGISSQVSAASVRPCVPVVQRFVISPASCSQERSPGAILRLNWTGRSRKASWAHRLLQHRRSPPFLQVKGGE